MQTDTCLSLRSHRYHLTHLCFQNIEDLLSADRGTHEAIGIHKATALHHGNNDNHPSKHQFSHSPKHSQSDIDFPTFESPLPSPRVATLLENMAASRSSNAAALSTEIVASSESSMAAVSSIGNPKDDTPGAPAELMEVLGPIQEDLSLFENGIQDNMAYEPLSLTDNMEPSPPESSSHHSVNNLRVPVSSQHIHSIGTDVFSPSNYVSSFKILRLSFHKFEPVHHFLSHSMSPQPSPQHPYQSLNPRHFYFCISTSS
jgi:hypothetical protein